MANVVPALLFLSLCVSTHVRARESQFFSKFAANAGNKDVTTEAVTTRVGPSEGQPTSAEKQAQETPSFVAQDKNGYGLYGHETGELPRDDVATTASFPDEPYYNREKKYNGFYEKDSFASDEALARATKGMLQGSSYATSAETEDNSFDNWAEDSRNGNYFPAEQQRFTNARLQGSRYTTGGSALNGRSSYYTGGNRYAANGGQKVQQQGMSDTRFLEKGKYFYDVDNEEKYNLNRYAGSRNAEFDTQGYLPNANRNNNYEYSNRNTNNNNYAADNFEAENAKVMAGAYDPVKNQYVFRASENAQEEFMP